MSQFQHVLQLPIYLDVDDDLKAYIILLSLSIKQRFLIFQHQVKKQKWSRSTRVSINAKEIC